MSGAKRRQPFFLCINRLLLSDYQTKKMMEIKKITFMRF